jgi:hypothetical protein
VDVGHYTYGTWPPISRASEPADPPTTPISKAWDIFSLPNSIARGLSSTVSSLLGSRHRGVDSSGPQNVIDPQLGNATEPAQQGARQVKRVKFNNRRQSKTLSEIDEEQRNSVAHLQLWKVKKQVARQQKPDPLLKSAMRKRNRSPMRNTSNNIVIVNTAIMDEAPLTRKRKYQASTGSYGVPDGIYDSSDSDEPATPTPVSRERRTTDNMERSTKKARVETNSPIEETLASSSLNTEDKKTFSAPSGTSFGLSDAFYEYSSSDDSDEEEDEQAVHQPQAMTTPGGPEPLSYMVPAPAPNGQITWTEPPPPAPTPAHAKLPGDRTENTESPALARARSLTELYKPARPSGLRRVSVLSASTTSPTPSPLGKRLDDSVTEPEEVIQEEAVVPEAHQSQQIETHRIEQANAQPEDRMDVRIPETEAQPAPQADAHHTDVYRNHEAEIQPAHQADAQHEENEAEDPGTPLAVDLVSKYPDVEFSPSDPSGLGLDRLVMSRLDENWTATDDERAVREWSPIFNYVKKYHQAEREGRVFIP